MPRKEVPTGIRESIIRLHQDWMSVRNIGNLLKKPKSTIQNIITRFKTNESVLDLPRSGRPKATTVYDDRKIVRSINKNPKATATDLANIMKESGVHIHPQTVRNRLHSVGYRGSIARCKPLISVKNRKARLEFGKTYASKPIEFWNKVLWTDETKINMFQSDGKCTVWRKQGKGLHPSNTSASVKHDGGNVMAWACMAAKGPGDLVFIDDENEDHSPIMDGNCYRKILTKYIQSNGSKLAGRGFIMQSDNDPKHTAKATQLLISKKKWKTLQWPSQSPDLNPIEHMFHVLKRKLRQESPKNKGDLKSKVLAAWKSISPSITRKLVHSMPRRLQAVISSKGYATKY